MVTAVRAEAIITAKNQLRPGLNAAARELERFRGREKTAMAAFSSTVGRALGAFGGAFAAVDVARRAFKSSVSMEREMYNVQRATDASSQSLKEQEKFLLDLARSTGKTKEELAQLYAAAGFAGRPARELGRFTEYASKATVAWGTNAQETGQALAEIGNIYEANQNRIEAIGDAINSVADGSASSEKDLIEILRRVGGAGKMLGVSAENMLAFGAALKEVGVGTEVASTGLNAMLTKIAVPDDDFDDALKLAGLKPKQFRKAVEKDATGAILQLLGALKKLEGTKRISVLKDLFGMEYADDIARLTGGYDRIVKLLSIANDKTKTLGSVRNGFTIALEKDFNRLDRAQQSIDVVMKRVGDRLKEVGGAFADVINQSVDASEKAANRLDKLRDVDAEAARIAGKLPPEPSAPVDKKSQDIQTLKNISGGKYDTSTLPYVVAYAENEEVRRAAEAEYRRQKLGKASREGLQKEAGLFQGATTLTAKSLLAGPDNIHSERIQSALHDWERLRQDRMVREFDNMRIVSQATKGAGDASSGISSLDRLASFGNLPLTIGKGKKTTTLQPPQLDMASAGTAAGEQYGSALNGALERAIAEATAKLEKFKSLASFSATPSINITVRGPGIGVSGMPVGKQGPN